MKKILNIIVMLLPWGIRRCILNKFYNYKIHSTAKIGLSYIYPQFLQMDEGATIGHMNVAVNLNTIVIGANSSIARDNWITGFPANTDSKHFEHDRERKSELIIGRESAITKKHHIDCTNRVTIGDFVTIAGYNSQLLTHSIDVYKSIQDSFPIKIGDYTFVSTNVTILGGSTLPSYSLLAAGAVLNKQYTQEWMVYGGIPAKCIKEIQKDAKYFSRETGFVY